MNQTCLIGMIAGKGGQEANVDLTEQQLMAPFCIALMADGQTEARD